MFANFSPEVCFETLGSNGRTWIVGTLKGFDGSPSDGPQRPFQGCIACVTWNWVLVPRVCFETLWEQREHLDCQNPERVRAVCRATDRNEPFQGCVARDVELRSCSQGFKANLGLQFANTFGVFKPNPGLAFAKTFGAIAGNTSFDDRAPAMNNFS